MYGKNVDANHILMDGVSLGNAAVVTSEEIYVGNNPGLLRVEIRAKTALTIATAASLKAEVFVGASGATAAPVSGTHQYLAHKDATDDEKVYAVGDLIGAIVLPKEHGPFLVIKTTVTEDHTTETVDCFLTPVA